MSDLTREEKESIQNYFLTEHENSLTDIMNRFDIIKSTAHILTERALAKNAKSREIMFADSTWSKPTNLKKQLGSDDVYGKADYYYYIQSVMNWSMTRKTVVKRTDRGCLATIRKFILEDYKRGSMKRSEVFKAKGFTNL